MLNMYTVRDRESQTFIKPFCMETDRDAKEGFKIVVNDGESNYSKFPNDFELIRLGEFDPRSGKITPHEDATSICWAKDLVENVQ